MEWVEIRTTGLHLSYEQNLSTEQRRHLEQTSGNMKVSLDAISAAFNYCFRLGKQFTIGEQCETLL